MKNYRILIIAILIITVTTVSGCGNQNNLNKDMSDMPQEWLDNNQDLLDTSLEKLTESPDETNLQFEVAFRYQTLGNYGEAIKYYEKVLKTASNHTAALNNIADIYEQVEDYELAAKYIKQLYPLEPASQETISDTVRILIKAGDEDHALEALENFIEVSRQSNAEVDPLFISDLYGSIDESKNKVK